MAKSKKPKPSFDEPTDAKGPSDTGWVYRSDPPAAATAPAAGARGTKKPPQPAVVDVSPAAASPARSTDKAPGAASTAAGRERSSATPAKPPQPPVPDARADHHAA